MKLTITYFTAKLENFINETNATDENLLVLLSHLTDSIQAFVLAAKVIQTNHTIESVIDKSVLSCENIFECLACNVQTGKTFNSVLNHISTTRHIAYAKQFEKQKKQQTAKIGMMNPNNSTIPVPAPPFALPTNRDYVMNLNQSVHRNNPPFPVQNQLIQNPQNHHMNNVYQPVVQSPTRSLVRPMVVINHRVPISTNQIHPSTVNNNILPMNGIANNFNQFPPPPDFFSNYKELFRMPPPVNVVGFQQNIVSTSNEFLRNNNPVPPVESDKYQSHAGKQHRNRKKRRGKSKHSNNRTGQMEVKLLDEIAMSFLKGNFENEVTEFINAAEELSSYELYTDITTNLKEICRQMGLNAEVKCFGSRIIGIGSAKSDIDLNVSVAGEYKKCVLPSIDLDV